VASFEMSSLNRTAKESAAMAVLRGEPYFSQLQAHGKETLV
jgi:hypothetical protein